MFEELNQHRAAVAENIQKATEIGFTGGELEKAHKVGDVHPNGKWVWTQLPSGRYDWRVIKKTGGGSSAAAPVTAQKKKDSESAKMMEFVNIVKQSPYHRDSERHLELMDDSELKRFRDFAYRCSQDEENLNQRTREECKKWSELADQEIASRGKSKKKEAEKSSQKSSAFVKNTVRKLKELGVKFDEGEISKKLSDNEDAAKKILNAKFPVDVRKEKEIDLGSNQKLILNLDTTSSINSIQCHAHLKEVYGDKSWEHKFGWLGTDSFHPSDSDEKVAQSEKKCLAKALVRYLNDWC